MHLENTRHLIAMALTALILAGCTPRPEEHANAAQGATAPAMTPTSTSSKAGGAAPQRAQIVLNPAGLPACMPSVRSVATIDWQVLDASVTAVDVKVLADQGREDLFASGGAQGSKQTGPWMLPGSTVVVRDHATGVELGRASMESLPCPQ